MIFYWHSCTGTYVQVCTVATLQVGVFIAELKWRQLILMPKSPSVCIYVYMSVTVTYGHLARGLEIVSVAIPMASSCSIYLYDVLNSRFRLLPSLCCTCGGYFGGQLRQISAPFSAPGPCLNLSGPQDCWAKWCQLPEKV